MVIAIHLFDLTRKLLASSNVHDKNQVVKQNN